MAEIKEDDCLMPFEVAGLRFRNHFLVASGPATKNIDQLVEAERCGWGGASLKLAIDPAPYINPPPRYRYWEDTEYLAFSAETRLTFDEALRLTEQARKRTKDLIVLANITYAGDRGIDGWVDMARKAAGAGAHAVELNMCCPNMSFNLQVSGEDKRTAQTGASLGQNAEIVGTATGMIVEAVDTPIFVKLTAEGGRIAEVAAACFQKGANVVATGANHLGIPDFDINDPMRGPQRLQIEPSVACMSGAWLRPLALRDVFEVRKRCGPGPCILGTGGIRTHTHAIQMMMCGADLVGICTETMLRGFGFLPALLKRIRAFMAEHGYGSYRDFRDKVVEAVTPADKLTISDGWAEIDPDLCTGCGRCVRMGHCHAITMPHAGTSPDNAAPPTEKDEKPVVVPGDCTGCSLCVDVCPAGAISIVARAEKGGLTIMSCGTAFGGSSGRDPL